MRPPNGWPGPLVDLLDEDTLRRRPIDPYTVLETLRAVSACARYEHGRMVIEQGKLARWILLLERELP